MNNNLTQPVTLNIYHFGEKAITYEDFVAQLHDRGLTPGRWAKNNGFNREWVYLYFTLKRKKPHSGIVAARIKKALIEQGFVDLKDGNHKKQGEKQ